MEKSKERTKADVMSTSSPSNQQALVQMIMEKTVGPKRLIIPGGKTMFKDLGKSQKLFTSAVHTWMRYVRYFSEAKIIMVKDLGERKTRRQKVYDFPEVVNGIMPWERNDLGLGGKHWLAERVYDAMMSNIVLAIDIQQDGLYVITPDESYSSESERVAAARELQESDNWVPHIDFTRRRRAQYDTKSW